jgi:hypothetical protein
VQGLAAELLRNVCMLTGLVLADNTKSPPEALQAAVAVLHDNALLVRYLSKP